MKEYLLFTTENCSPCTTVKSMISSLPPSKTEPFSLSILNVSVAGEAKKYDVRTVPTLVEVSTGEKTNGVLNIISKLRSH